MPQKTFVIVDGTVLKVDWIMHLGKAWLVPEWFLSPDGKMQRPRRIISLAMAKGHESYQLGEAPLQYFQSSPIPKSLLDHGVKPIGLEKLIEVQEESEIWLPNPDVSN